jgi:enoyl-CoA hydratase/carnithine racemase
VHQDRDEIRTVILNRPEKLNALTPDMLAQFRVLLDEFRDDDELRVLLIRANGKYYSSGVDIAVGLAPKTDSGIAFRNWYRKSIHTLFDEIESIEKPVISAAQGPCLGGALEMALSCDFRLASNRATYGLPETNIGALPGSGGISRLTRIVGPAEARWMVMAAQTIDAERALRVGLVHEVYAEHEFEARCLDFARHLVSLPAEVQGAAKVVIDVAAELGKSAARDVERLANTHLSQSKEHRDLVRRFLDRKK